MSATLKLLGSTLSQVVERVEQGGTSVPRYARVLAAALALSAVSGVQANEYSDAGNVPAERGTVPTLPTLDVAQDTLHKAAQVGGAIVGGVVGNRLFQSAGGLVKAVATLGGAAGGAVLGGMAVPGEKPALATRQGGAPTSQQLNEFQRYEAAVKQSFAVEPLQPSAGHPLPAEVQRNLSGMMADTAATRLVASRALSAVNEQALFAAASSTTKSDQASKSRWTESKRIYNATLTMYGTSLRNTWNVIRLAQETGYDVAAQKLLMDSVPADLRMPTRFPIAWPGVETKASAIAADVGIHLNYAELHAEATEASTFVTREQHR